VYLKGFQIHKVEKCVITASIATMAQHDDPYVGGRKKVGPHSWSLEKNCDPYYLSKFLAEKAAWEFQKNLPEDEKFPIVTIHPGTQVSSWDQHSQEEALNQESLLQKL
jgi:nucleoside-diphosphate-sugar epimerase